MSVNTIAIAQFWTEYVPAPTTENPLAMKGEDWVEYGPIGSRDRSTTRERISRLFNVLPMTDRNNPAVLAAHERKAVIERAYEAWRQGQEVPVEGTPLAAWNGISREQADVLRVNTIRTVEELAALGDAQAGRINLPHLRELIKQAQRFLDSADTVRYSQELAQRDATIADQGLALTDQGEQIKALMAKVGELAEMVARKSEPDGDDATPPLQPLGKAKKVA